MANKNSTEDIKKTKKLSKYEKIRRCTKCKKEFITKFDSMGISYNTRCKKCKTNESYDHSGRLNGRLGKVEAGE